jgi:hypothetical protein
MEVRFFLTGSRSGSVMKEIIRAENITKRFENFYALKNVNFSAHEKKSSVWSATTAPARRRS